jgi:hypothetical protein
LWDENENSTLKGRVLNVKLVQDAISIDDVVVVGAYGTAQKRLDQVGSAFQVNADQLKALQLYEWIKCWMA